MKISKADISLDDFVQVKYIDDNNSLKVENFEGFNIKESLRFYFDKFLEFDLEKNQLSIIYYATISIVEVKVNTSTTSMLTGKRFGEKKVEFEELPVFVKEAWLKNARKNAKMEIDKYLKSQ